MSRLLAHLGWDVTLAASDFHYGSRTYTRRRGSQDRSAIEEEIDGVTFAWLWSAPYERNDWRRARNWLSFSRSVVRWSSEAGPYDIVVGSSPHLFAALAAQWVARFRWSVPFVFEVRDLWPESLVAAGGHRGPAYFLLRTIARYLYGRAHQIVCLAKGSLEYLVSEQGLNREQMSYIPNGVDVTEFESSARPEWSGTFTAVYAGAHGPANGLDLVLDAAWILKDRMDIRFLLVGDGPEKERLAREAQTKGLKNVEFRDPVPKSEIPSVLAGADAGLMVLRESPLFEFGVSPNKLFDYMGAGLPVVCNVPGDVAQMVRVAGAGEVVPPGSGEELAVAVADLSGLSPGALRAMGQSGREWVRENHDRTRLAGQFDDVLREVLRS